MLDTDHVGYALRGRGNVADVLLQHRPSALCLSALSVAELRYGADKRGSKKLHRLIDAFTNGMDVMAFDDEAALQYGSLASRLAKRGVTIGQFDTLIAAHAMSLGVSLVTNNVRHFSRVKGLKVENWV